LKASVVGFASLLVGLAIGIALARPEGRRHSALAGALPPVAKTSAAFSETPGGEAGIQARSSRGEEAEKAREALASALRNPSDLRREHDVYLLVCAMSASEVASAIEFARALPSQERYSRMPKLVARWAEHDPAAAARFPLSLPDPNGRSNAMIGVMGAWAATDPGAAKAWVSQLPANDLN
jgi:hypothetical protein